MGRRLVRDQGLPALLAERAMTERARSPRVVIVGAGMSGIAMGVALKRARLRRLRDAREGLGRRRHLVLEPLSGPQLRRALAALPVLLPPQAGLEARVRDG